jgi:hypothetical protein
MAYPNGSVCSKTFGVTLEDTYYFILVIHPTNGPKLSKFQKCRQACKLDRISARNVSHFLLFIASSSQARVRTRSSTGRAPQWRAPVRTSSVTVVVRRPDRQVLVFFGGSRMNPIQTKTKPMRFAFERLAMGISNETLLVWRLA